MKTIVVTGATSFIGRNLVAELLKRNRVIAVIRKDSKKKKFLPLHKNMHCFEVDMTDYKCLSLLLGRHKPIDAFIHLAWNGTRGKMRDDSYIQKRNLKASLEVLRCAEELGIKMFIMAGSQAEYGPWKEKEKLNESVIPCPNTEYGKAKLAFYEAAIRKCKEKKIKFIEPRFFSLYGPGDYEGTMIISMLKNMLHNTTCNLTESIQTWDFLYIDDAIRGIARLLEENVEAGVYNFGSGESHPLRWYVEKMAEITGTKSDLNFGVVPYPPTGMVNVNPDVHKLMATGWKPQVSFEAGIETVIKSLEGGK